MNPLNVLRALLAELVDWFNETFERPPNPTSHVPQHRKSRDSYRPPCLHCQTAALMRELQPAVRTLPETAPEPAAAQPDPSPVDDEPGREPATVPAMTPVTPDTEQSTSEFACGAGTGVIDWPTGTFRLHVIRRPEPEPYPEEFDTRGIESRRFMRNFEPEPMPVTLEAAS